MRLWDVLLWAQQFQRTAPVSRHHERAVAELWPWVERRGITTALEIGAGEPPFLAARMLREHGVTCLTLDVQPGVDIVADAHYLPVRDGAVDLVVARHVLEHVLIPPVVLMEMARVTRRYLLVVVPWDSSRAIAWPDHLYTLPREGWERMYARIGLRITEYAEGDHTEEDAQGRWIDHEWRYLLESATTT